MTDPWGKPEIPRDRFGRPLIVPPTGGKPVAYTRATTFVGALEDRYNLGRWEMRMVALGLAKRPDLVLAAASLTPDDKGELDKVADAAKEAAGSSHSATIGTALHKLTERLDRGGEVVDIPAAYAQDISAYQDAMAPLKVCEVERFTVLDSLRIGGTPDLIVEYDGVRYIADKKTGSVDYGQLKIAMQLAVYSRSMLYDLDGSMVNRETLGVDQDRAIVIHLPAGTGRCELKWVDIKRGWDAVQVAADVRSWRTVKGLMYPLDPVAVLREGGFEVEEITIFDQIAEAVSDADLGAVWLANRGVWTDAHTAAAKKRKAEIHQLGLRDAVARATT